MTSAPVASAPGGARHPGAVGAFALFGEVLWTGILVALCSLPIVTLPASLAAGIRHLRRYVQARDSRVALYFSDVRSALLPGGLGVGFAAAAAVGVLVLQLVVVPGTGLPGAEAELVAVVALLVAVLTLLSVASAGWAPSRGWRYALGMAVHRVTADPVGALLVVVAVGLTALAAWQLPPLLVPALGCLAFAMTVITARRR